MSFVNHSQTNVTAGQKYRGLLERALFSTLITVPCCVFLYINVIMLFTLRSKSVFCETSRYILLYNLLSADTVQMVVSQLLYLLAACRITLTYPVCGVLVMLANPVHQISPLTLVVMSLERYVAVCYPLRHAAIVTSTNTGLAVTVVWAFSSLNILIRVLLLLNFQFEDLQSLQMTTICSYTAILLTPIMDLYIKAYTGFVFVTAAVAVVSSYIGVVVAARSASTDKASAHKARNTLLLHMVQLGLTLCSTLHAPIIISLSTVLQTLAISRLKNVLYVLIYIFPRCLTSLIYGLRDQTIRLVLFHHLCCQWRNSPFLSGVSAKVTISMIVTS